MVGLGYVAWTLIVQSGVIFGESDIESEESGIGD